MRHEVRSSQSVHSAAAVSQLQWHLRLMNQKIISFSIELLLADSKDLVEFGHFRCFKVLRLKCR